MFRARCLACNSLRLARIIDLGMHPFADTFIPEDRLSESEPVYPLSCNLCQDCGHVQTSCITNPLDRYDSYDYSYTSANSDFSRAHWQQYAREVPIKAGVARGSLIVDAGSNDGFLPEHFKKEGYRALGVDPSRFMAEVARGRGVDTVIGLFNSENADRISRQQGKAALITANNVFNHADSPQDFLNAADTLLEQGGVFVFECPYWASTIETKKFDQIYHEHVSYFTVKSAKKILETAGMVITDVQLVNYHGGSLRVFARRAAEGNRESGEVSALIQKEESAGLFRPDAYGKFMENILSRRNRFLEKIYGIKSGGGSVVAVGAAAKGNTFLNFYNLNHTIIDYVTDASAYKCGKWTPLSRIPIQGDKSVFSHGREVYAIILSWNIADQLKRALEPINPRIRFISPE